jgi:hypothetical protein
MDFVVAFDKRCLLARAFIDQKPSKSLPRGSSSSHRRGSVDDSSNHSRHSHRSRPDPPSTPTPAPSIHSQTKNRTNVRRTPASEVREEYLAAISPSSRELPGFSSHDSQIMLFPDATKRITQLVLDGASNSPPSSVSSGPLAGLSVSQSESRIVASARPRLFRHLIRTASRWMRDRRGTAVVKRDDQIVTGLHASWTTATPAPLAATKE